MSATSGNEGGRTDSIETAVFGAGCFWGVQELMRALPGVINSEVGYCGGRKDTASYTFVKKGDTDHAESVRIEFDPRVLSFGSLLDYFFRLHDPTTPNQQGNDRGSQYRSVIFYQSESQREVAEAKKRSVDASGKWKRPVVTEIVSAQPFFSAEDYHQDYLQKNPDGYTCHWFRD